MHERVKAMGLACLELRSVHTDREDLIPEMYELTYNAISNR